MNYLYNYKSSTRAIITDKHTLRESMRLGQPWTLLWADKKRTGLEAGA